MAKKTIIIDIDDESGEMSVESIGFTGQSCISEVDGLLKDIGTSADIRKKPEYYRAVIKGGKVNA